MILQGNSRGGARNLALHLLEEENDHVEVHEIRGFVSDNLVSALKEVEAVSRGTKAKQYLFSLSLNPPPDKDVSVEAFEKAVDQVENKLGFKDQPRAIVFHEKEGRRHCHTVWSRIDAEQMKAIPLPFSKRKLMELSRELYIEHGWEMPKGLIDRKHRDPTNFSLAQWQQAKRNGLDPKDIKRTMQDCWAKSDNQQTFSRELKEQGYVLAKGDRRAVVVLDHRCEVYSVSKWVGIKSRQVKERIADRDSLPSVDQAKDQIATGMLGHIERLKARHTLAIEQRLKDIRERQREENQRQQHDRQALKRHQEQRWVQEVKARQERYNRGLRGLIDRFTGKHSQIKEQNRIETEQAMLRDQAERDAQRITHLKETRSLSNRIDRLKHFSENKQETLSQDMEQYQDVRERERDVVDFRNQMRSRRRELDRER